MFDSVLAPDVRSIADSTVAMDSTRSTADAGGTPAWHVAASGTTRTLHGVWGSAATNVYVVGDGSTLLHSTDGGASFAAVLGAGGASFWSVWGSSASDVYAVGSQVGTYPYTGAIEHFDGSRWSSESPDPTAFPWLTVVWGSSASDVYAFDEEEVQHSNGSGAWAQVPRLTYSYNATYEGAWGSSATDVYAVLDVGIFHSADHGTSWTSQIFSGFRLQGIWGSGASDVYAVGTRGTILHSGDGGLTWNVQASPTNNDLYGVWGSSSSDLFAVGAGPTILHTSGGGTTWTSMKSGAATTILQGVWGSGPLDVYAVGDNGLIFHYR